ncbi:MAG: hypothetical protein ACD_5C00343G0004 [uncultured bacterium]|nr:MAG: hypothetical protein ACD_5C00343G0004 [uncultured bacterium]
MKCPICNIDLQMTERQGVEIDYCPQCRGVWLDRGELDKIIEKTESTSTNQVHHRVNQDSHQPRHDYDNRQNHGEYGHGKKHKRESLLGELFDF